MASPQFSRMSSINRSMVAVVLTQRKELAIRTRAETNPLLGARTMADIGEHHLAGERELDWPVEPPSSNRGEGRMRPGKELAAEARADEKRDYFYVFLRDAENLRHDVEVVHDSLGTLVKRELFAIVDRDRSVHLHRVVGLDGGGVRVVDLDRSRREDTFGIASVTEDSWTAGCADSWHGVAEVGGYIEFVRGVRDT